MAMEMAKTAGRAACNLEKPPVADQVHVVLWVIKANDVRFTRDLYRDKFEFVREILNREGELESHYSTLHYHKTSVNMEYGVTEIQWLLGAVFKKESSFNILSLSLS